MPGGPDPAVPLAASNPRVKAARKLKRVRNRDQTLIEGPHLLVEAAAAGARIIQVFASPADATAAELAQRAGARFDYVDDRVLAGLTDTVNPRGPVAVIQIPAPRPVRRDLLWVMVSDPGNGGTLIRTAAAFGQDVVFHPRAVDPWSPKVLRAAAGGHFRTNVVVGEPPAGWGVIALTPRGGIPPEELGRRLDPDRRWALAIGWEAEGLDPELVELADVTVTIPMPGGVESLNAAVAGAITGYWLSRWRG